MLIQIIQLVFGLLLGITVALFHRPIADFMLERERALDSVFRSRGIHLPPPPEQTTTRDVYFVVGILIALLEIFRIWITILR